MQGHRPGASFVSGVRARLGLAVVAALFVPSTVSATPITGALSTPGGLITGGNWASGYKVTYSAEFIPSTNLWHYIYTYTKPDGSPLTPATSHAIVGMSANATAANIFNVSGGEWEVSTFSGGGSNPGMPGNLYGIKNNMVDGTFSVSFDSNRQPMWTDFYAKGGSSSFAYNSDFGVPVANPNDYTGIPVNGSGDPLNKILGPDTVVPEPQSFALLAIGGLAWLLRRKRFAA
jgi:hypothetical protein